VDSAYLPVYGDRRVGVLTSNAGAAPARAAVRQFSRETSWRCAVSARAHLVRTPELPKAHTANGDRVEPAAAAVGIQADWMPPPIAERLGAL
jgi:hypothetical protein